MFSVIIPLYNKGESIRNTIRSVLNQTYDSFEIIVINDGSKDKSALAVEEFRDSRIRLIHQDNQGVSAARNRGIKAAKNEWIAFLDGDDEWNEEYLKKMMKLIIDFPLAEFYGCQYAIKKGENLKVINDSHRRRGYINNYFREALKGHLVSASSIVIKKDCFKQVGLFNPLFSRGEDIDMWTRLARNFTMAFEPSALSYYIQDSENRACNTTPHLNRFYLKFNLKRLSKDEKAYFLKLGEMVMLEMFQKKRFRDLMIVAFKYRHYSIAIIRNILKRKIVKQM